MFRNGSIVNLFRYAWRYSPSKKLFLSSMTILAIAECIALIEPLIIGWIFNSVQFAAEDPRNLSNIVWGMVALIVMTIVHWSFWSPARILEDKHAFLVRKNYRQSMFDKVLSLPVSWHKNHHSGDTIDKIKKAADNLFDFSSDTFIIVESFIGIVGAILILAFYDWRAILAAFLVALLAAMTVKIFDKKLRKGFKIVYKAENFLSSGVYDYISNILTVVTLRLKKRASKEINKRSMKAFDVHMRNAKAREAKWFLVSLYIRLGIAGVIVASAYNSYKIEGMIMIGSLFILYKYLERIGSVFYTFTWKWGQTVEQDSAMKAAEVINKEYKKVIKKKKYALPEDWQSVKIRNLHFDYKAESKEKNLAQSGKIDGASLVLEKGKKIALIGESGSGKSTIFSLIRGLHTEQKGKVYCDGKKLDHGLAHLNQQALLIPQEPELFNSTIEDNISMGLKVSKEEIERAMQLARFEKVVARLKKGLKTNVLEKGVSLSGGEKQRLALSRGLLVAKDYDLILLDEPTSSVDSENELAIYQSIFKEFPQKTILSAIHRLHLLRYFDYVYYFKRGKIITEGTFEMLLEDSEFKKLWKSYNKQK